MPGSEICLDAVLAGEEVGSNRVGGGALSALVCEMNYFLQKMVHMLSCLGHGAKCSRKRELGGLQRDLWLPVAAGEELDLYM